MTHPSLRHCVIPALLAHSVALPGLSLLGKFLDPLPPINRQVGGQPQPGPPANFHHPKKA